MRIAEKFDSWVERGPFTPADLGIYRIVYAVSVLMIAPNIAWLGDYPDFMFRPPTGPIQLFSSFPSPGILVGLEVLRSIALVMLAFGLWTRFASFATAAMLITTYGITYSLGKVDHTILLVLVPLVLAFANWGDRYSIDALRAGRPPSQQQQWPLRLLGLLIGWGFFTAALTKALTGWLSFDSQAARGYFVLGFVTQDRTNWLAGWVAAHDYRPVWELADWSTVAFELAILLALPWWRAFRTTLAIATLFHLGVYLVMNITFSHAVIAYGAFVPWGALVQRMSELRFGRPVAAYIDRVRRAATGRVVFPLLLALAALLGVGTWSLMLSGGSRFYLSLIIFVGAAFGMTYLALEARTVLRRSRRGPRAADGDTTPDSRPAREAVPTGPEHAGAGRPGDTTCGSPADRGEPADP
ncbi:HTTM domain-containing protein [Mycobacterium sp. IS-1496]|uniref:HTTM domain-containing protein n=1 Tax=Mycobacterium sp. IS-1496 TaxID=1772284 RepID=UPI000B27C8CC|nr:HTTM domain-containing protein [Mycobacterium sp. IS-1496]